MSKYVLLLYNLRIKISGKSLTQHFDVTMTSLSQWEDEKLKSDFSFFFILECLTKFIVYYVMTVSLGQLSRENKDHHC